MCNGFRVRRNASPGRLHPEFLRKFWFCLWFWFVQRGNVIFQTEFWDSVVVFKVILLLDLCHSQQTLLRRRCEAKQLGIVMARFWFQVYLMFLDRSPSPLEPLTPLAISHLFLHLSLMPQYSQTCCLGTIHNYMGEPHMLFGDYPWLRGGTSYAVHCSSSALFAFAEALLFNDL